MTFQLNFHRSPSALGYRFARAFGASAFVVAGFFWGGSLAFVGMSLESVVWFVVAIVAFVTAVCIVFCGTARLLRSKRVRPAVSAIGQVFIGMMIGNWLVGLVVLPY